MDTTELSQLEQDINHMISTIEKLRVDNLALNDRLKKNQNERERLMRLNKKASLRIQQIIRHLKGDVA